MTSDFHLRRRIPPKSVSELTQEIVNETGLTVWDAKVLAQEMYDASLEGIYRLARIGDVFLNGDVTMVLINEMPAGSPYWVCDEVAERIIGTWRNWVIDNVEGE